MNLILIVDDNADNLYMLRKLMEGHDYTVMEARHGGEALQKARQTRPVLIVSDLLMPVMDGYSLLKEWKADPSLRSIPFVVYTATYTDPKDERLAINLGADAFIIKPAEPDKFIAQICHVMEQSARFEFKPSQAVNLHDNELMRDYNVVLVNKLEKKARELELTNKTLRAEVAERIRAEEQVEQTNRLLRAIADGIPDAIFVKDLEGKYLLFNAAAAQFVGRPVGEVLGRDDTELFDRESATIVREHDRLVMESNQIATTEEVLTAAGIQRTFLATKSVF